MHRMTEWSISVHISQLSFRIMTDQPAKSKSRKLCMLCKDAAYMDCVALATHGTMPLFNL